MQARPAAPKLQRRTRTSDRPGALSVLPIARALLRLVEHDLGITLADTPGAMVALPPRDPAGSVARLTSPPQPPELPPSCPGAHPGTDARSHPWSES